MARLTHGSPSVRVGALQQQTRRFAPECRCGRRCHRRSWRTKLREWAGVYLSIGRCLKLQRRAVQMNHHLRRAIAATVLVAFVATQVAAASVIPPTFAELVGAATDIFVGEVVTTECRWVSTPGGPVIVTIVTFAIEESLKGVSRGQTTLQFRGGRIGDVTLTVADMPEFRVRDRDVLFVGDRGAV